MFYIWELSSQMPILPPKHSAVRVRLTQADRDVLVARAQRSGVALSVIIRRAIRLYLNSPDIAPIQATEAQRKKMELQDRPASKFLSSADGRSGA